MIMFSVYRIYPEGRMEFVSDAGSASSASILASEHSSKRPYHCVVRGLIAKEARYFRNGRASDN